MFQNAASLESNHDSSQRDVPEPGRRPVRYGVLHRNPHSPNTQAHRRCLPSRQCAARAGRAATAFQANLCGAGAFVLRFGARLRTGVRSACPANHG